MSQSITSRTNVNLSVSVADSAASGQLANASVVLNAGTGSGTGAFGEISQAFTNGSGTDQVNKTYWAQRTLAASANDDLDLTSLTDRLGASVSFTGLRLIFIRIVTPTTAYKLTIGGGTNAWLGWMSASTDRTNVYKFLLQVSNIDGFAAIDGTHKTLRINNPSAASVVYDILLLGY